MCQHALQPRLRLEAQLVALVLTGQAAARETELPRRLILQQRQPVAAGARILHYFVLLIVVLGL
jgi:hypothetical protein